MCLIIGLFHRDPSHVNLPFYPNRLIHFATLVSHSQGPHFSSGTSHLTKYQPKITVVVRVKGMSIKKYTRIDQKW